MDAAAGISPERCLILFHQVLDGISHFNRVLYARRYNWADAFESSPLIEVEGGERSLFASVVRAALPANVAEQCMREMPAERARVYGYQVDNPAERDYVIAMWREVIALCHTRVPSLVTA